MADAHWTEPPDRAWRILVTPAEACRMLGDLPSALAGAVTFTPTHGRVRDGGALAAMLGEHDAAVLDVEPVTADALRGATALRVISRFGEGCDAIDLDAARAAGIRVANTRGVAAEAVARHALALTLALTHQLTERDRALKAGRWERHPHVSAPRMTLGVVGFGRIGTVLADMAGGLGFRVLVWTPSGRGAPYAVAPSLQALVAQADIVSLHVPLTPETRGLIGPEALRQLAGKWLVNTARGAVVDEAALLAALDEGLLVGYATDVFEAEPVTGISARLAAHHRVVATPHVAALDPETAERMTERAVANAVWSLQGAHEQVTAYVV